VSQATGKAEREIALAMIDWRGCDHGYGVSRVAANASKRCSAGSRVPPGLPKSSCADARVDAAFTLALVAYNLIRLPKLLAVPI
jgi:hypothetical protein